MTPALEFLAKTLLDAPMGYVEQTVSEIVKKPVKLKVIEQNPTFGTNYIRKVIITCNQFPIVRAVTRFDSRNLSEFVMTDLLQKKEGIGSILRKNNIRTQRQNVSINFEPEHKKITRNYEIIYKNLVWFQVYEEIRLDFLSACQNC